MVVFAFYAHTLFNLPSSVVTPISAALIAGGLIWLAILALPTLSIPPGSTPLRNISIGLFTLAWGGFVASAGVGFFSKPGVTINDMGVFAVEVGTPVLLLLNRRRGQLIDALGTICVGFACADMLANFLAAAHIIDLPVYSGRLDANGYRIRYPGLTGNTDASGLVAMVAIFDLAAGLRQSDVPRRILRLAVILALVVSLNLIDARRYFGMGLIGLAMILIPGSKRVPPIIPIVLIAVAGLWFTFSQFGFDDDRRARLMIDGYHKAITHPWLGEGIFYKDPANLQPSYQSLHDAGVTESGVLDLAIAYGIPAALSFVLSPILALCSFRPAQTGAVVILTMLTAALAFGNTLPGFFGAVLFYGCLIYIQRDEVPAPVPPNPLPYRPSP